MPEPQNSDTFGRERVTPQERDRRMADTFRRLAPYYDRLCDVQTFGLHRYWRRALVRRAAVRPGQRILDVAGGGGEIARRFAGPDRQVIVLDRSVPMMIAGRSRGAPDLGWVAAVARALPFPDNSMDTVTMAFGLRNVTYVGETLKEVLRVLKPCGRFLCLEVSRPWTPLRPLHYAYCRYALPRLGAWITKDAEAFDYLVESIFGFPGQIEIKKLMEHIGFKDVHYHNLSLGVASIHVGTKEGLHY